MVDYFPEPQRTCPQRCPGPIQGSCAQQPWAPALRAARASAGKGGGLQRRFLALKNFLHLGGEALEGERLTQEGDVRVHVRAVSENIF